MSIELDSIGAAFMTLADDRRANPFYNGLVRIHLTRGRDAFNWVTIQRPGQEMRFLRVCPHCDHPSWYVPNEIMELDCCDALRQQLAAAKSMEPVR